LIFTFKAVEVAERAEVEEKERNGHGLREMDKNRKEIYFRFTNMYTTSIAYSMVASQNNPNWMDFATEHIGDRLLSSFLRLIVELTESRLWGKGRRADCHKGND
jgi:hypothetical protein